MSPSLSDIYLKLHGTLRIRSVVLFAATKDINQVRRLAFYGNCDRTEFGNFMYNIYILNAAICSPPTSLVISRCAPALNYGMRFENPKPEPDSSVSIDLRLGQRKHQRFKAIEFSWRILD